MKKYMVLSMLLSFFHTGYGMNITVKEIEEDGRNGICAKKVENVAYQTIKYTLTKFYDGKIEESTKITDFSNCRNFTVKKTTFLEYIKKNLLLDAISQWEHNHPRIECKEIEEDDRSSICAKKVENTTYQTVKYYLFLGCDGKKEGFTKITNFTERGGETTKASFLHPDKEKILLDAIRKWKSNKKKVVN